MIIYCDFTYLGDLVNQTGEILKECVFMYLVKDLEHIQRWINWLKARYPKIEFEQIPHWNTTYNLHYGVYCVPNPKVKVLNLSMVVKALKKRFGIEYVFFGPYCSP